MLTFPFFERVPDQSVIAGQNGERYDRAIATRGNDYLMNNYTGRPMEVDFSKISGARRTHGGTQPRMVNWNISVNLTTVCTNSSTTAATAAETIMS